MRVIYVEDNANNQKLLERILSKRQIEVICFENPHEAIPAILEQKPDMLFVDIHLKARQTGLDVVKQVREAGLTMPIIVLTAFAMMADREHAQHAGCDAYLNKPYSMTDLLSVVDRFIAQIKKDDPNIP